MEIELRARVTIGKDGLHLRPTAILVNTLKAAFPYQHPHIVFRAPAWTMRIGDATVSDSSSQEINPFDFFSLISLGWVQGTVFEVICKGDQAVKAFETLRKLFTDSEEASENGHFFGTVWEDLNKG